MSKNPPTYNWIKFFHKDWFSDWKINACDAACKGIYMSFYAEAHLGNTIGVISFGDNAELYKLLCKKFGLRLSQFKRALSKLIEVELIQIGKNNELILVELVKEKFLVNTQRNLVEDPIKTQQELNENSICTQRENKIPENRQKSEIACTESDIDSDIELESKKDSPQTPQPLNLPKGEVVPINETTKLFTKSVQVLQERIRSSELECHKIVGRWFKQSGQDAPLVAEAIQAGLHGNNPVAYISAILKSRIERRDHPQSLQSYPKTNKEQLTEEWGLCKNILEYQQKYADEEPTLEQLQAYSPKRAWGHR
ncbi:hypothetical protein COMNV_00924 [Commensalibacter sp. Nvir]|uniref:hypothetical protein n=1 Tax=Commensalibacter sp. Nvir TaxID=3069817 RepID=UPI002D2F543A|nr:hypothetical protein COMNV_00924 [Commensalibacter sp. Nvir]